MVITEHELDPYVGGQLLIRQGGGGQSVNVRRGQIYRITVRPDTNLSVQITIRFAWMASDENADATPPCEADWRELVPQDREFPSGSFIEGTNCPHGRRTFYSTALLTTYTFCRPGDPDLLDRGLVRR